MTPTRISNQCQQPVIQCTGHQPQGLQTFDLDNDFDMEAALDNGQAAMENRLRNYPIHLDQIHIEPDSIIEVDEEEKEKCLAPSISMVIDLTGDDPQPKEHVSDVIPPFHLASAPRETLREYAYCGELLRSGITIEIPAIQDLYQASFLYIKSIIYEPNRGVFFSGLPLARTRNLRGKLPRLRNELCLIIQVDKDNDRPEEEQGLIEVEVPKVIGTRALHFTNADFPSKRYPSGIYRTVTDIEQKGILVCRWRCRLAYRNQRTCAKRHPPEEFSIEHLSRKDASSASYRVSDAQRRNFWRGGKTRGGAFLPCRSEDKEFTVNIETETDPESRSDCEDQWIHRKPGQQYTFADMFCGAGGASCGAEMAGFLIKLSCDKDPHACETYRHRFPGSDLHEMDIFQFIKQDPKSTQRVDAMHISPPCQFWSPAHTVPGVNDEANIASLFACHELVKRLRPRVFTLEQTFGILDPRFEHYFNALIYGFTQYSYSLRWRVVDLLIWGNPAKRRRLIMIGSCPGEKLPPFPPPRHSERPKPGDGTRPYVTVRQVLRKIMSSTTMRHPLHLCQKDPWDPNVPLQRTITCSGGIGNYHYSGRRFFNLREYATLQGFPVDYEFRSSNVKKQIGNAFPPCVVKTIYQHIKKCLYYVDRIFQFEEDETSEPSDIGEAQIPDSDILLVDDEDDDALEYLGQDYTSPSPCSSSSNDRSDFDVASQSSAIFAPCIDANQSHRRMYIDLTGPIDLTRD